MVHTLFCNSKCFEFICMMLSCVGGNKESINLWVLGHTGMAESYVFVYSYEFAHPNKTFLQNKYQNHASEKKKTLHNKSSSIT